MKTVLLIEDNQEMRENTAEILELSEFNVITAKNGKEGVEAAKKNASVISVILCDIMMPELDGYGVLHILAKLDETKGIPFIFLSAKAEKQDFRTGMNLGADDYLIKPFTEIELLDTIERRIERNIGKTSPINVSSIGEDRHFVDAESGMKELIANFEGKRTMKYKKKETIFHEGDYPSYLYMVRSGSVKTYKLNKEGKEFITSLHRPGDIFDYASLLMDEPFNISAQALDKTELAVFSRKDFFDLIQSKSDICAHLLQSLSQKTRNNDYRLLNMAYDSVRKRVARGILFTSDKLDGKEVSEEVVISREDLANIVGTSTESVIRTLHDFKEEGLLDINGRTILIKNIQGLKDVRS